MHDPLPFPAVPESAPMCPIVIDLLLVLFFAFEIAPFVQATLDALAFALRLLVEI